jgi:hypothetical protein
MGKDEWLGWPAPRVYFCLWLFGMLNVFFLPDRFLDCEKWRKEFGTDELPRTFDYKEKKEVFEYYPQYYHRVDKVPFCPVVRR